MGLRHHRHERNDSTQETSYDFLFSSFFGIILGTREGLACRQYNYGKGDLCRP
jgi:hypothetical protein